MLPEVTSGQRRDLERAIEHQMLLVADARACQLWPLYHRRRERLRQLRQQLADLDGKARAGPTMAV